MKSPMKTQAMKPKMKTGATGPSPKVFILTDMEGVAGITSSEEQCLVGGRLFEQGKRLLTAEVNAAAEGAFEEGAAEVLVFDAHGPGGVDFETIHPKALLLHGRPLCRWSVLREVVERYDLTVVVGQHAMMGVERSVLNHTQSSATVEHYKLNGKLIGETAQWALFCGALGIPVIFLAGDHEACREAKEFVPGITTVAVKEGLSRSSAVTLSAPEARKRIRAGVRAAMQKQRRDPVAPLVWKGPFVLEKRYFHSNIPDLAYGTNRLAERVDGKTIRLKSDRILDVIYG